MSKQEWFITGLVAVAVATMTGALFALPAVWADDAAVTVPALPPAQLEIPSLNAKVTATATPVPGNPVQVALVVSVPAGGNTLSVPVTVTVQSTTMSSEDRSITFIHTDLAKKSLSVSVDSGGEGKAVVDMPLTWATQDSIKQPSQFDGSPTYELVLTSPSVVTSDRQLVDAVL